MRLDDTGTVLIVHEGVTEAGHRYRVEVDLDEDDEECGHDRARSTDYECPDCGCEMDHGPWDSPAAQAADDRNAEHASDAAQDAAAERGER
jgi:hypothetical protein